MNEYLSRNDAIDAIKSLESSMPAKDNYAKGYDAALGRVLIAVRDVPPTADVQPVDRWIRVENELPNDGERVNVYTVEGSVLEMKFDKRRERWGRVGIEGMNWFGYSFITHWQPLPEPPNDRDKE